MDNKQRFRPTLRQYRILEAANKELKESYDIAKVNLDIACDGIKFYKEAIDTNNKDLCKAFAENNRLSKRLKYETRLFWYLWIATMIIIIGNAL